MAAGGTSTWVKVLLGIGAAWALLVIVAVIAGYSWWKSHGQAWSAEQRQKGQAVTAEGRVAGATATKDQCVRLAIRRTRKSDGLMDKVRAQVFLESCLGVAKGELSFCADAPSTDQIMKTVAWRLKTSQALGLRHSENPIVKGIQQHCMQQASPSP